MTNISTVSQVQAILEEAYEAASVAATNYFRTKLGGVDQYSCGFAWVEIVEYDGKKVDGRSKIGKLLKSAGVSQNWQRTYHVWNPAKFSCQNIDTLEAGARAYADVLKSHGFAAYSMSRLD